MEFPFEIREKKKKEEMVESEFLSRKFALSFRELLNDLAEKE